MTRNIRFGFRWPVIVVDPRVVEVQIPVGDGPSVLNPEFTRDYGLSDKECELAEDSALRSIALVQ
jgi:hypothetical protein